MIGVTAYELPTGGALSKNAGWENWYAAGNFGQERL